MTLYGLLTRCWSGNILKKASASCSWASMPWVGGWLGQRITQSFAWRLRKTVSSWEFQESSRVFINLRFSSALIEFSLHQVQFQLCDWIGSRLKEERRAILKHRLARAGWRCSQMISRRDSGPLGISIQNLNSRMRLL